MQRVVTQRAQFVVEQPRPQDIEVISLLAETVAQVGRAIRLDRSRPCLPRTLERVVERPGRATKLVEALLQLDDRRALKCVPMGSACRSPLIVTPSRPPRTQSSDDEDYGPSRHEAYERLAERSHPSPVHDALHRRVILRMVRLRFNV
jgi:hypothetical protein